MYVMYISFVIYCVVLRFDLHQLVNLYWIRNRISCITILQWQEDITTLIQQLMVQDEVETRFAELESTLASEISLKFDKK